MRAQQRDPSCPRLQCSAVVSDTMVSPPVLGVLKLSLCGALFLLKSVESTDSNAYPSYWNTAPGKLNDFPKQANHAVIQPWRYPERLGMYKILLLSTDPYFSALGLDSSGNLLWGLALQHGWQFDTGRLADPSHITTCGFNTGDRFCASVKSWWACMNYQLAVIPFLAAADAGLIKGWQNEIQILPPESLTAQFCYSISGCKSSLPNPMRKWKYFFEYLKSVKPVSGNGASAVKDTLIGYLWDAHTESIDTSLSTFQDRLRLLSGPEAAFGKDWSNAVHFIAATHFETNFQNVVDFQIALPSRVLINGDNAPDIAKFNLGQNRVLENLKSLRTWNTFSGGILLATWEKAMCSEKGREAGRQMLKEMVSSSMPPLSVLWSLLTALVDPSCQRSV